MIRWPARSVESGVERPRSGEHLASQSARRTDWTLHPDGRGDAGHRAAPQSARRTDWTLHRYREWTLDAALDALATGSSASPGEPPVRGVSFAQLLPNPTATGATAIHERKCMLDRRMPARVHESSRQDAEACSKPLRHAESARQIEAQVQFAVTATASASTP